MDLIEATTNAVIGLVVSWCVTFWLTGFTALQSAGFTALFFGISFARSYAVRKVFRWLS